MAEFNIRSNISDVTSSFGSFASSLTGPVVNAVKAVNASLLVLAANPIGAVIAAFGVAIIAVTAGLSKLQPVIDRVEIGLARLSATWSFVIDTIGSYLGIAEAPQQSLSETIRLAGELTKANQALEESQIALTVRSAELRSESREALLLSADQTLSTEERVAALQAAGVATEELFRIQRDQLTEEVRIQTELVALTTSTREERQELADLQARLIALDGEEATALKEITGQQTGLIKAQRTLVEQQEAADQAELDRIRELRQEREIDLLIAGGATEEEVFEARLERAESEEERAQIMHEAEVARIEGIRDAKAEAAEQELKDMEAAAKEAEEAKELEDDIIAEQANAVSIAEDAKREAINATVTAGINALTSLLGDSKGAQIAGLIASNAFEAAQVIISGSKAAAAATNAANAAAVPTAGASLALLPAQLATISATTASGLTGIGVATGIGIAGILAAPGEKPSGGGGSASSGSSFAAGPTVATPDVAPPQLTNADGTVNNQPFMGMMQPTVLLTPTSGPGSLESSTRANNKRNNRRRL